MGSQERNNKWRKDNPLKDKAIRARSYHNNKHKHTEQVRAYQLLHRVRLLKARKELRKRHKSKWLEIIKELNMLSCSICGYARCFEAIDFHHRNPQEKEMGISGFLTEKPTQKRIEELKKCISVCANCHREIHHGGSKNSE